MTTLKTKKNETNVEDFINAVEHEAKRKDAIEILAMMKKISGEAPKMWGTSIIGFGDLHYKYASGREGEWFKIGFSPRKANLSLYISGCDVSMHEHQLTKLGKHKTGKGCLYINKLDDVNKEVLKEMIEEGFKNPNIPH